MAISGGFERMHPNRYTAMVDRHVGAMAACLQDSHPLVRRHAILLISQLLLQVSHRVLVCIESCYALTER